MFAADVSKIVKKSRFASTIFDFYAFYPQAVFALAQDPTPAGCGRRPSARQKPRRGGRVAGRGGNSGRGETTGGRQQAGETAGGERQRAGDSRRETAGCGQGGGTAGRERRRREAEYRRGEDKRRTVQGYSSPSRRRFSIPTIRGRAGGRQQREAEYRRGEWKRRTEQGDSRPSRRRFSIPTIRGRACGR